MTEIVLRLLVITAGYLLACLAGTATLFYAAPETSLFNPPPLTTTIDLITRAATIVGLVVDAPAVLAAGLALAAVVASEILRLRGWPFHVLAWGAASGVSIATSSWLWDPRAPADVGREVLIAFVAAGFVAGLTYWLVAGRSA